MRVRQREGRKGESATKAAAGREREKERGIQTEDTPLSSSPCLRHQREPASHYSYSENLRHQPDVHLASRGNTRRHSNARPRPCSCRSSPTQRPAAQHLASVVVLLCQQSKYVCTRQQCLLHAAEALLDGARVRTAVAHPHPTIITLFLACDYAIATLRPTRPPLARAWEALLLGAPAHKAACCRVRRQGDGVGERQERLAFAGGRRVAVVGAEDAGVVGAVRAAY